MTGPGELEAYVLAIERHLRTWRGAEHVLSPRDFALARSWYEAGVPLAHVLVGIDRAFEADPQAFVPRFLPTAGRGAGRAVCPRPPRSAGKETVPLAAVEEVLRGLEERLLELPLPARGVFGLVMSRVRELRDLVAVAARPNWDYLRAKLREIDKAVGEAAPLALDPEESRAIEAEAARSRERHADEWMPRRSRVPSIAWPGRGRESGCGSPGSACSEARPASADHRAGSRGQGRGAAFCICCSRSAMSPSWMIAAFFSPSALFACAASISRSRPRPRE